MNTFELIKFKNGEIELNVNVSPSENTVWLTLDQIGELFDRERSVIGKHIKNIFKEGELEENSVRANFAHTASDGKQYVYEYFNLDVIISVGYRTKSRNAVIFRKWASSILKDYLLKGYAINQKRLEALNKTVEIQSKIIASACEIDANEVRQVVDQYTEALTLLDNYDHQCIPQVKKDENYIPLTYEEVKTIINNMEYKGKSEVFGVEKEEGKLEGILAAVYQNVFGQEVYPSIKEKAAHLLYFLIKDHPFADGCKRIAAATFLTFLSKNKELRANFSSQLLVATTLLVAESNPDDIEPIIQVIANII